MTYTYNNDNTLATTTDAKNQRQVYTYDNFGRIVQIARGTLSGSTFTEDLAQRSTYAYEGTNNGFSTATNGRVSQVTYAGPHGTAFVEMYSYHNAGGVTKKRVQITGTPFGSNTINMDAAYTYDGEGRVLSIRYPFGRVNSNGTTIDGPLYNYTYDTLGRLQRMTDLANNPIVNDVIYGPADEMLTMTASTFNETRTYNANLQLTELVSGTNVHLKYNYSASQNNGQIVSQQDLVSGETISYQYDSLKRLVQASAAGDPSGSWAQNFSFDGFGNLTEKTSTNAPQLSVAVDWATNRIQSFASYDNNGNMTGHAGDGYSYDLQNRMIQASVSGAGTVIYGYDWTNHRTYKGAYSSGIYSAEELYFYGVEGHKYGTWKINASSGVLLQASVTKQWFGGRLVSPEDRLGSKGKYFAFGEERTNVTPANPPNDQEKFATYTRDSATGLDYANQRYYSSIVGRFTRPDPYGGSASVGNPQSWNRYSYVGNDPANEFDPDGLAYGPNGYYNDHNVNSVNVYASVDPIATVGIGAPSPAYGYSPSSGGGSISTDPLYVYISGPDPALVLADFALRTREIAQLYPNSTNDCVDMSNFASEAALVYGGDAAKTVDAFGILTPNNRFLQLAAIQTSSQPVLFGTGLKSGYLPQYRNSDVDVNGDQGHHFAAFFQIGFRGGIGAASAAAVALEMAEGISSPFNYGDVSLALAAGQIGADLSKGYLHPNDLGNRIVHDLCNVPK